MKPSNPFANYSTAQSLGYEDPDAERIAAQLELRRSQGIAGEWQIITPPQAPVQASSSSHPTLPTTAVEADNDISLKREAEAPLEEDSRSFKLRKKSLNPGLGEIYDPGLIPIKVKKEEAIKQGDSNPNGLSTATLVIDAASSSSSSSSKWAKPQWSAPLPDIKPEEREKIFGLTEEPTDVTKTRDTSPAGQGSELKVEPDVKTEDDQPPIQPDSSNASTGGLFKKRKVPAGATKGRRQI